MGNRYQIYSLLMTLGFVWIYFCGMESSKKQGTFGKMAMGIRVTDLKGNRLTFLRAMGRFFAKFLISFTFGVGHLMILFTKKKQALHDKIASTLVVRKHVHSSMKRTRRVLSFLLLGTYFAAYLYYSYFFFKIKDGILYEILILALFFIGYGLISFAISKFLDRSKKGYAVFCFALMTSATLFVRAFQMGDFLDQVMLFENESKLILFGDYLLSERVEKADIHYNKKKYGEFAKVLNAIAVINFKNGNLWEKYQEKLLDLADFLSTENFYDSDLRADHIQTLLDAKLHLDDVNAIRQQGLETFKRSLSENRILPNLQAALLEDLSKIKTLWDEYYTVEKRLFIAESQLFSFLNGIDGLFYETDEQIVFLDLKHESLFSNYIDQLIDLAKEEQSLTEKINQAVAAALED